MHTLGFFCGFVSLKYQRSRSKKTFMKTKQIILSIFVLLFTCLVFANPVFAENAAGSSAKLLAQNTPATASTDMRVQVLHDFLKDQGSPLANNAKDFVDNADKYDLDWKLVAAISGVESTFGQEIPPDSYNGWGWGVYGDHVTRFNSWNDAITTISKGLKQNYIDKGADNIYAIGNTYAASPAWADHVTYFMNKIQTYSVENTPIALSFSF